MLTTAQQFGSEVNSDVLFWQWWATPGWRLCSRPRLRYQRKPSNRRSVPDHAVCRICTDDWHGSHLHLSVSPGAQPFPASVSAVSLFSGSFGQLSHFRKSRLQVRLSHVSCSTAKSLMTLILLQYFIIKSLLLKSSDFMTYIFVLCPKIKKSYSKITNSAIFQLKAYLINLIFCHNIPDMTKLWLSNKNLQLTGYKIVTHKITTYKNYNLNCNLKNINFLKNHKFVF